MPIELAKIHFTRTQRSVMLLRLKNWGELTRQLPRLKLDDVRQLLAFELQTRCRLTIVQRLAARYGTLAQREVEAEVAQALARRLGKR